MTYTDHDQWLYIYYRSLPATLYMVYTIMYVFTEYTKTTRSCTMTLTGHDQQLYNQYRSLPATLCKFYTIMWNTSEYTNITRSYTKTYTDHDPRLYIRITLLLGRRSTRVGIGSNTHGRALPTVRILVPSSRRVSVWPNAITQSISAWYMIAWYLFT